MESFASNLLIFSVQIAVVIGLGSAGAAIVRLPVAGRLTYWRSVLAASLLVAGPASISVPLTAPAAFVAVAAASLAVPDRPVGSSLMLSDADRPRVDRWYDTAPVVRMRHVGALSDSDDAAMPRYSRTMYQRPLLGMHRGRNGPLAS